MKPHRFNLRLTLFGILATVGMFPLAAQAADIDLADAPVLLLQGVDPNLVLTLDESVSMFDAFLPDAVQLAGVDSLRGKSAELNRVHYDPSVVYLVPSYAGVDLPAPAFTAACLNPFRYYDAGTGTVACPADCQVDLTTAYRSPWQESLGYFTHYFCDRRETTSGRDPEKVPGDCDSSVGTPKLGFPVGCETPAFYYVYDPAAPGGFDPADQTNTVCDNTPDDDACYRRIDVGSDDDLSLLNRLHPGLTIDAVWARQNFANWFAFYRNRILAARSAVSLMMADVDSDVRVGFQALFNGNFAATDTMPFYGVAAFGGADKTLFYDWLFDRDVDGVERGTRGDTPLLDSAIRVGEYFSNHSIAQLVRNGYPYNEDPADGNSPLRECRRNYHVLFTDGAWTDQLWGTARSPRVIPEAADANWDADWAHVPWGSLDAGDGGYTAGPPFADTHVGGLADVTFYYWSTDLLEDEPDNVNPLVRERVDLPLDDNGTVDVTDIYFNPRNDPATWQHVVTYTVGLGVDGHLDWSGQSFPDWIYGQDSIYGDDPWTFGGFLIDTPGRRIPTIADPPTAVDDLWHAAINGRGQYFSAANVEEIVDAFETILSEIGTVTQSGSAAAVAVTGGALTTATQIYQPSYNSAYWSGELLAYDISAGDVTDSRPGCSGKTAGDLCSDTPAWTAAGPLDTLGPGGRRIVTFDGSGGVAFLWGELTAAQQEILDGEDANGEARVAYLRGNHADEGTTFRLRQREDLDDQGRITLVPTVLGDLVNSPPLFVGPPGRRYSDEAYRTFADVTYDDRPGIVYVGGNDGMLHAFCADGDGCGDRVAGQEVFAYIPGLVFGVLADLTATDYVHQFSVDGPLAEGDVKIGGNWSTLLVGALGKGAQGLFALDITNPVPATETEAAGIAVWEIDDSHDPDLGYVYGTPAIHQVCIDRDEEDLTCTATKWVVITGNGYNSTSAAEEHEVEGCTDEGEPEVGTTVSCSGDAVLFVLDAEDGSVWEKLSTGVGTADDPRSLGRANGLAAPTVVDADGDLVADFAYAGDLFGNVWKFDLVNFNPSPVLLFNATDGAVSNPRAQPITTPIAVERHPTGFGSLLLFGTGKLLGPDDVSDTSIQTFYGIWDNGSRRGDADDPAAPTRDNLLAQDWLEATPRDVEAGDIDTQARLTTDLAIGSWGPDAGQYMGWYLDLDLSLGERVVTAPAARGGRVVFVSTIPSLDPCVAGGESWVNALDVKDGSRLPNTPFDFDLDGIFGSEDLFDVTIDDVETKIAASSIRLVKEGVPMGVYSAPTTLTQSGGTTFLYVATSEGEIIKLQESSGLEWRGWQELLRCE
jgi:type IV pilus assembly protein PilY1